LTENNVKSINSVNHGYKKVAGIILAAGKSTRMGSTKQLLPWSGTTILGHIILQASMSYLDHLVLVLGHKAGQIVSELEFHNFALVFNPEYDKGQSSSLKKGINNLPNNIQAAIFLLADQPLISFSVIDKIIDTYIQTSSPLIIPVHKERRGNPVLIDRSIFPRLMRLQGDTGARAIFDEYSDLLLEVDIPDQGICLDIDTWDEYIKMLRLG